MKTQPDKPPKSLQPVGVVGWILVGLSPLVICVGLANIGLNLYCKVALWTYSQIVDLLHLVLLSVMNGITILIGFVWLMSALHQSISFRFYFGMCVSEGVEKLILRRV